MMETDRSSKNKLERYSRQILLPEIGRDGQEQLSRSIAVIIGMGALGCNIANNLARAGVGEIKLVDKDIIELNNLQRQTLYDENDVGTAKVTAAFNRLKRINSDIIIRPIMKEANTGNINEIIMNADVVLDGTDNIESRFLINDACVKNDIPWIYGGAVGTVGMTKTIIPYETACLRCFIRSMPPPGTLGTANTHGISNAITGIIGAIESSEAIKVLLGKKEINRDLIVIDVWKHDYQSIKVSRDKACKCCTKHDY